MSSAVAHHFQHVYYFLGFYENILKNPEKSINWPDGFELKNLDSDFGRNQVLNLFRLKDFLETGKNEFVC